MSRNDTRDERDQKPEQEQPGRMLLSQGRSGGANADDSNNAQHHAMSKHIGPQRAEASSRQVSMDRERLGPPSRSRDAVRFRDQTYRVSAAERTLMTEVGRFRTVAVVDLAHFLYSNDHASLRQDLLNLKAQGLIQQRQIMAGKGRQKLSVLTLTKEGKRLVKQYQGEESGQAIYAGFVKPQEIAHDAALYRMYQAEANRIEERGGKVRRVILDYELKKRVYAPLAKARELPPLEFAKRQAEVAAANGLTVVEGRVPLPDLRIEYETPEGHLAKADVELATEHYHGAHAAGKLKAGFTVYADSRSASRLNASLTYGGSTPYEGPELTAGILAL